jgi:hypothetical protein
MYNAYAQISVPKAAGKLIIRQFRFLFVYTSCCALGHVHASAQQHLDRREQSPMPQLSTFVARYTPSYSRLRARIGSLEESPLFSPGISGTLPVFVYLLRLADAWGPNSHSHLLSPRVALILLILTL